MDKKEFTIAGPVTVHEATKHNFEDVDRMNAWVGNRLAHIHSEISEAWEAMRDNDHESFKQELADAVIYIIDLGYHLDMDLEEEVSKKLDRHHAGFKHNPY